MNKLSKEVIDKVYKKYKNSVNMNAKELKQWSKKPCSKKASLNREPIKRNLRLLSKPKTKWTSKDAKEANKAISYLARAKKIKSTKSKVVKVKVKGNKKSCGYKKNGIALKNWAFDKKK